MLWFLEIYAVGLGNFNLKLLYPQGKYGVLNKVLKIWNNV